MSQKFDMNRHSHDYDNFIKAISVTIIALTLLLASFALFIV
ncbi:MAG: hypothetical protein ORO03_02795 [Alphaproteobacteria bacterium]|nr:hypothetical protein [Alphaproteobacteria bacterium]